MQRLVSGAVVLCWGLLSANGAWGITFPQWASNQGYDPNDVMPSILNASSSHIDSLAGIDNYDWTTTPTTELNLTLNNLTGIPSVSFSSLTGLATLDLSRNEIAAIAQDGFQGLTNLTELLLNGNSLTSISAEHLSGLPNLTDLKLNGNDFTTFTSGTFSGQQNLNLLWLQNNAMLEELNFTGAEFSNLVSFTLVDNENITEVSLRHAALNQSSLSNLMDGGNETRIGIGEIDGITELDMSGFNFGPISDLSPLYLMDDLTDLWLPHASNLDANDLDQWLDDLDTIEGTGTEGALYMTQADFDALDSAGSGLLSAWDAEPGHHVEFVIPGDFDLDGDADGDDFLLWQQGGSPEPLTQWDLNDWEIDYGTAPMPVLSQDGDFDEDGDVDGDDFLVWQQGGSPLPLSESDLLDWESNFGFEPLSAGLGAVPEPSALLLAAIASLFAVSRRRLS